MDLTEWNYLQRFARTADEEAFAFFVQRYGPLVLGVCRRQTGDAHLAEDAFQATFLVLARRAGDLNASEPLANWLFGVAMRTARQMRTRGQDRAKREQRAAAMKALNEPAHKMITDEAALEPVIDSALDELPERLRMPLVLCAIQGKTYEQAATELQLSHDVVRGRIAQARERLREQLARRGVVVPAAVLLSLLGGLASSALSLDAVKSTAHAAAQWKSGGALAGAGAENASHAAGEVLRNMAARSWLGWGAAAGVALLMGTAAIVAYPQTKTVPVAVGAPVLPVAPRKSERAAAPVLMEAPKKAAPPELDLGEGAANLLAVSDVKLNGVKPQAAAEALSKQYNVNIQFSEPARDFLANQNITLEAHGLTGIEVLQKLAQQTGTDLTIEEGKVILQIQLVATPAIQDPPETAKAKAPEDF